MERQTKILFIGDSVTDCGRDYTKPDDLGYGYPRYFCNMQRLSSKKQNLRVVNRGINGNRVRDLQARWQADCLDEKPDILSVLIGINDTWRRFDSSDPTSAEEFFLTYKTIISQFKDIYPDSKLLIIEPFLLPFPDDRREWITDLAGKIAASREIAREFADYFIPLDGIFAAKAVKLPMDSLTYDGVHPTDLGHTLIANEILSAVFGG